MVEQDVTHPFEYDFYLSAHSAIQGTARPVHYHVIKDEMGVPVNEFQRMIYQLSYQYMRSTTPVSLCKLLSNFFLSVLILQVPAVYYAHIASNRARCHESAPSSAGPRGGQKFEERQQDTLGKNDGRTGASGSSNSGALLGDAIPLLPLGNPELGDAILKKIRTTMCKSFCCLKITS